MGQKVHPKGLRLGIIQSWDSTWIADSKSYAKNVKEDEVIRKALKKKLKAASVSRIEIDRKAQRLIVRIITGRPGMVVGRGGQGLDTLRKEMQVLTGRKDIQIDVMEVNRIDADLGCRIHCPAAGKTDCLSSCDEASHSAFDAQRY